MWVPVVTHKDNQPHDRNDQQFSLCRHEPKQLALGDDGSTLYTSLNGAFAIRRFDISRRLQARSPVGTRVKWCVRDVVESRGAARQP